MGFFYIPPCGAVIYFRIFVRWVLEISRLKGYLNPFIQIPPQNNIFLFGLGRARNSCPAGISVANFLSYISVNSGYFVHFPPLFYVCFINLIPPLPQTEAHRKCANQKGSCRRAHLALFVLQAALVRVPVRRSYPIGRHHLIFLSRHILIKKSCHILSSIFIHITDSCLRIFRFLSLVYYDEVMLRLSSLGWHGKTPFYEVNLPVG